MLQIVRVHFSASSLTAMFYLLLAVVSLLFFVYCWKTGRPRNFPPGPPCLPVVGTTPFMSRINPQYQMEEWRVQYGPVVGLMLGARPAVAVVEAKTVLEVLRHEDYQGRPVIPTVNDRTFGESLGVFFSEGSYWVDQRRFTMRNLKDFGFGKRSMEGLIMEEAEVLVQDLRHSSPKTVQVNMLFVVPVINVLWSVMSGVRHGRDDQEFQRLLDQMNRMFRSGDPTGSGFANMVPALRSWSPRWRAEQRDIVGVQEFMRKAIREHEKTFDADNLRDFIDVYIKEMQQGKPDSGFHEKSLISVCLDLFGAGAESVSNTLGFCLLYFMRHPEVQPRIHEELDRVVGRSRRVSLEDRAQLVYLEATLQEVSRINTIAPLTAPHRTTKDTTLLGYDIPKDTIVLLSLRSCGHDVTHWGDPGSFRPERHVDAGRLVRDDFTANFGVGKRVCLGETLARNTSFLFLAAILQELEFALPEGHEVPGTVPLPGFTVAPAPFEVVVKQRG